MKTKQQVYDKFCYVVCCTKSENNEECYSLCYVKNDPYFSKMVNVLFDQDSEKENKKVDKLMRFADQNNLNCIHFLSAAMNLIDERRSAFIEWEDLSETDPEEKEQSRDLIKRIDFLFRSFIDNELIKKIVNNETIEKLPAE